jgi:hypothetical protein
MFPHWLVKFCIHLSSLKILPSPYSKDMSKKVIIQTKLVGMYMSFHCTKLHLSKCNSSLVVSIKQNVNFKFQLPAMFLFVVFRKNGLIKSCSSSENLSEYKISWPYVNWCKFCIHLKFEFPAFWNGCSCGIKNCCAEVTYSGMTSLLNFIKIYQLVEKLMGGDRCTDTHTDRMVMSLAYILSLGRKVG